MINTNNLLLTADVYKASHQHQYPKGLYFVQSYLESRGSREERLNYTVFFGLQYYLKRFFSKPVTHKDVDEWVEVLSSILGKVDDSKFRELANLGYIPLKIRAVPEGTVVNPLSNVLMTVCNTHPKFGWLTNYVETLLLKIWSPITVATNSLSYKLLMDKFSRETCDNDAHLPFQLHDFGMRGVSSHESAEIAGAAHLLSFLGTDTTTAVCMLKNYYNAQNPVGLSVPAGEHSACQSWSKDKDDKAYLESMIETYPDGIVSIIADTYDLFRFVDKYAGQDLRDKILSQSGRKVFRPDSGLPENIICGDDNAPADSLERKGIIRVLGDRFGSTINSKGYKVLNPKVGCIYGDAITYDRAKLILTRLKEMGYASSNIVFGCGGLLLNNWNRDTLKLAFKATLFGIDGEFREIGKDPKTDSGKKSKWGRLALHYDSSTFSFSTKERCTFGEEYSSLNCLRTVYEDGLLQEEYDLNQIRDNVNKFVLNQGK